MPDLEQDAWLPTRLAKLGVFIEVEKKIYDAYTAMIRDWLEGITESVLEGGVNPLGVYSMTSTWLDKITEFARNVITWALSKAYQWALGESYEFTNRPFVQQYIAESTNRLVNTPDHVYEKVKAAVATGTAEGQSIPEIAKQIKTDLLDAGAPYWKNRAVTVARTETIGAYNGGANDAFSVIVGEFPEDEFEKIWLATDDSRTRHTHNEADGQRVSYSADFSVGGHQMGFPGDPRGPAEEVINCRCTMLLVEHGEEVDYSNKGFKGLTASVSTLPPPLTAPALIAAAVPYVKPDLAQLLAAAWISGDWKLHATCSTTFCRTPLHPGPCKGWKHTLKKVAPGVYDALESARIAKLEAKRKAKITALKEAGKPIPKSLQNKITSLPTKAGPYDPTPDQKPLSDATEKKLADVTAKTKKAFPTKEEKAAADAKAKADQAVEVANNYQDAAMGHKFSAPAKKAFSDQLQDLHAKGEFGDLEKLADGWIKHLDAKTKVYTGKPLTDEKKAALKAEALSGLKGEGKGSTAELDEVRQSWKAKSILDEPGKATGPIDGDGDGKLNEWGDDESKNALKNAKTPDAGDITDAANQAANMAFAPNNFSKQERIDAYAELTQADIDSMNEQDTSNLIDDLMTLMSQAHTPGTAKKLDAVWDKVNKQSLPGKPGGDKEAEIVNTVWNDGLTDNEKAAKLDELSKADYDKLTSDTKATVDSFLNNAYGPKVKELKAKFTGSASAPVQGVDSAAKPTSSVDPDKIGKLDGPNEAAVKQALDVTNNTYKYSFDQIIGAYTELSKKDFDSLTKVDQKTIAEKVKGFASNPILTAEQRDKAASLAASLGSKYPHGSGQQVETVKAIVSGDAGKILNAAENLTKDEFTGLAEVHQKAIKDAVKVGINNPDLTSAAKGVDLAFLGGKAKPTIDIPSLNPPTPATPAAPADPPAVTQVKNVFDPDSKATDVAKFYAAKALTVDQFKTLPGDVADKVQSLLHQIAKGNGDPKHFIASDKEKANATYKKFYGSDAPGYKPDTPASEPDVLADLIDSVPVVSAPPAAPSSKNPDNSFDDWQSKKTAVAIHAANTNAGKITKQIKNGTVGERLTAYQTYAGTKAKFDKLPVDVQDAIVADLDNIYEGSKKGFFTPDQSSAAVNLRFTLTDQNPMTVFTPKTPPVAPKKAASSAAAKKKTSLSLGAQMGYDTVAKVGDGDPLARLSAYDEMSKDDFESLPATTQKQIVTDLGNMAYATGYTFDAKKKEYSADFGSGYNNPNKIAAKAALMKLINQDTAKGWKPKTKAQKEYEKLGDAMFAPGDGSSGTLGSTDAAMWDKKVSVGLKGLPAQKAAPADMTNSNSGAKWQGVYSTPQFTGEQQWQSVQDYKGSGYTDMNVGLRNNKGKLNDSDYWGTSPHSGLTYQNAIRSIDEVMKKSRLTAPIVTYRGFGSPDKVFKGVYNGGAVDLTGMEFTDYGYQSTSTSKSKAEDFAGKNYGNPNQHIVMKIFTPKGYGAIKVSGPEYENEILLDRSTRYRIVRDNGVIDGARRLDVEVIGPGENG